MTYHSSVPTLSFAILLQIVWSNVHDNIANVSAFQNNGIVYHRHLKIYSKAYIPKYFNIEFKTWLNLSMLPTDSLP